MSDSVSSDSPALPAGQVVTRGRMLWFVLLLVIANLVWAGQGTAVKYIPETLLGPFAIAFLPFFFITPLFLPLLWWKRPAGTHAIRPTASDWMRFVVAGVGGQLVAQLGMTWGTVLSDASSLAILYLMIPVITAPLASLLLKERVTTLRITCLAIGLMGVLLMSTKDLSKGTLWESKFLLGNLLILGGCFGASFYNVYCKGLMEKFHERDILIYSYITATVASLPILLWKEPNCFRNLAQLDANGWIAFAFLTLLVYGITMLMLFYVLQFLPVTVVLASTYLVTFFGVVIPVVMLDERLDAIKIAGAAIVLAATVLIMWFDTEPAVDSTEQPSETIGPSM